MAKLENIYEMIAGLTEENKRYVIAVANALVFSENAELKGKEIVGDPKRGGDNTHGKENVPMGKEMQNQHV